MALRKPNSLSNPSMGLSVRDWPEAEQPHQRLFTWALTASATPSCWRLSCEWA